MMSRDEAAAAEQGEPAGEQPAAEQGEDQTPGEDPATEGEGSGGQQEDDDQPEGEAAGAEPPEPPEPEEAPKKTAKQRRAALSKDRDVQALVKAETDKAVRSALKAEAERVAKTAEREKLEASERLELEKKDLEAERDKAQAQASEHEFHLQFYQQLVACGKQLVDADAVEFVRMKAAKLIESDNLDMGTAVAQVLEDNTYLISQPETGAAGRTTPARTQPPKPKKTEAPAPPPEKKPVDAKAMTKQEFRKHLRTQHGVESTH